MQIRMQPYSSEIGTDLPDVVFDLDTDGVEITIGDTSAYIVLSEFQLALIAMLTALASVSDIKVTVEGV